MSEQHWNKVWQTPGKYFSPTQIFFHPDPCDEDFLDLIGDVSGKNVLDLGCGRGELAVYLAGKGANVTAIDNSNEAIKATSHSAQQKGVEIKALTLDAFDLENLGQKFDLVTGRFILHHLEPFNKFVPVLLSVMKEGGRGIFLENNSRSKLLMFFRKNIVGHFGTTRKSDDEEYPLEPKEVDLLTNHFNVRVYFPKFMFFYLFGAYFTPKYQWIRKLLKKCDDGLYKLMPVLRKYSYRQIVELTRR